jgi:hypothetical protein
MAEPSAPTLGRCREVNLHDAGVFDHPAWSGEVLGKNRPDPSHRLIPRLSPFRRPLATTGTVVMNRAILTPRAAALERIKALVLDGLPRLRVNGRMARPSMISSAGVVRKRSTDSPRPR